ncbi:hypothetical protein [Rhizocola hellebori]|uniref:hypothetical protein n=1 Tax=Rhizocola hellebori TaxID=1392758 RepID=UPI001EF2FEFD|nr:hypothetical protein [Rhizocola hellebori]
MPITVWPVPAPAQDETMSNQTGVRLVHNLTHPSQLIIDLTDGPQLARAVIAAGRRSRLQAARQSGWGKEPATLIVTGWPHTRVLGQEFFALCRAKLLPGGCVAVLLAHGNPILPADVVAAAKAAGLRYLQHVVAATGATDGLSQLDIHTDVLIFTNSGAEEGGR